MTFSRWFRKTKAEETLVMEAGNLCLHGTGIGVLALLVAESEEPKWREKYADEIRARVDLLKNQYLLAMAEHTQRVSDGVSELEQMSYGYWNTYIGPGMDMHDYCVTKIAMPIAIKELEDKGVYPESR